MKEINLPSIAKEKLFLLNQLIKNNIFPKIKWIDLAEYLKEKNIINLILLLQIVQKEKKIFKRI